MVFSAADGAGVGVDAATFEVAIDGAPVAVTHTIDTFLLDAGLHTVTVAVADRLGNATSETVTFRVRATSASLLSNIDRARTEGLITNNGAYNSLVTTVQQAVRSHNKAKHETEWNQLVSAQRVRPGCPGEDRPGDGHPFHRLHRRPDRRRRLTPAIRPRRSL